MKVVLTSDGSRTLFCDRAGECFHSESGALSESQTVFLENSGVRRRMGEGKATRILEIGFGTGLNFLLTADQALAYNVTLDYTAIDTELVPPSLLAELGYEAFLQNPSLLTTLREHLGQAHGETEKTVKFDPRVQLRLLLGRAESLIASDQFSQQTLDCVYLDAFSPSASPALWTADFLAGLYNLLVGEGTLVTYCVKSEIQKRLRAAGFTVNCLPGPQGGKRQVLRAVR